MKRYKDIIIYSIFILVLIVWLFISIKPKVSGFITVYKDVKTKTIEVADLERKLETLKAAEIQKDSQLITVAKKVFKPTEAGLDTESSFANIFEDIIQMARYNNIRTRSIEYVYNPPEDPFIKGASEKYNVCQLNMSMIGDYADFETFLQDIYKYPYLVNFIEITIKPYEKNKNILLINLKLKLYSEKEGIMASQPQDMAPQASPSEMVPPPDPATQVPGDIPPAQVAVPVPAPAPAPAPSPAPAPAAGGTN